MTSSDVLDTCLSVQLSRARDLLIADVDALLAAIKARAFEHKYTPTIAARMASTPSPPPSPKARGWLIPSSARKRAASSRRKRSRFGTDFRAVGNFANTRPAREEHVRISSASRWSRATQ